MKYIEKPKIIEAIQWFKLGDHPKVKEYPMDIYIDEPCKECGALLKDHGYVGVGFHYKTVCVGAWIISSISGEYSGGPYVLAVNNSEEFHNRYKLVVDKNNEIR